MDQERLRSPLGSGMSNKIWEATLEHAKECVLNDKYYSYCNKQGVMLLIKSIFELVGAMFDHNYHPVNDLNASQKVPTYPAALFPGECDGEGIKEYGFSFSYSNSKSEKVSMNVNRIGNKKNGATFKSKSEEVHDLQLLHGCEEVSSRPSKGMQALLKLKLS